MLRWRRHTDAHCRFAICLQRKLPVGAHRAVLIPVTVKGCRPVFKFYTDLRFEAEALSVCHSQVRRRWLADGACSLPALPARLLENEAAPAQLLRMALSRRAV